ncbi:hypothetical protein [Hymenobacter jeollabukensis]|uniref:Uncharacterized protein n=1 Tax=Hymenobacter jeollabukensis TaxID=2025313 RepID=A0A5R8WU23_9BACT|nr:hypothetical protein [Hymenobacter jeollabukensis]TLM95270.1 hypothetical protein FDY95_05645 [Hymenobacter jeollabukensis]
MEDYAAKMAGKPDAELLRYVERRVEYIEAAVLAALAELERRGHVVPGAAALRPELEAAARQAATAAPPAAPAWARTEEVEEPEVADDAPALYSPGTIAILSVVLSYPVGAVLMLLNLLRLRRYGGAALLMALSITMLSAHLWLLFNLKLNPNVVGLCSNIAAALIYVFVLWPYFIGARTYQSRSWLPPLIITFALVMLLMMLAQSMGVPMPGLK